MKLWLTAGLALEVVAERTVGLRVPTVMFSEAVEMAKSWYASDATIYENSPGCASLHTNE